jgi:membrane-associated phospholipid phosphatase
MLDVRAPPGVFVAKVLNVVAGGTVTWIVRAAIAAALAIWRRWRALAVFALAELCAELCIGPVKALVDRPRPAGSLAAVTGQSMPSGHALIAAVTALALALILTRPGQIPAVGHRDRPGDHPCQAPAPPGGRRPRRRSRSAPQGS